MAADHALPLAPASSSSPAVGYCIGFSCALAALGAQGRVAGGCDLGASRRGCGWSRARELALREKVGVLERQVEELRHRRAEDARANEKVAGIFASHEQRWFTERKSLRRQVHAVVAAARAREAKREEEAEELRRQLEEQRDVVALKDRALEHEIQRREGKKERLRAAEQAAEELRKKAGKDALEHAAELRKHKAAFVELASAQRQLEADMARAARLADTAEAELRAALERRDEAASAAADLSAEAARLRRDADHKDKILSAMLRKSKIDMEDREMLVREVKMCKARRKQAELEAERWRKMWESRGHRRGSSRSSARCAADQPQPAGCSDKLLAPDAVARATNETKILFVDHVEGDGKKDYRQAPAKELTTIECVDRYASHVDDKPGMSTCSVFKTIFQTTVEEYQGLQEWFQMETEKYTAMINHRHSAEIEAFTEQLRLKDEKLEAFRWRAVSMDVEATRLRCRIQDLEARLAQHEKHNAGVEALLLKKKNKTRALKEQLETLQAQALGVVICTAAGDQDDDAADDRCIPCSPVKIRRTMSGESDRLSSGSSRNQEGIEVRKYHRAAENKPDEPVSPAEHKEKAFDVETTEALVVPVRALACAAAAMPTEHERHDDTPARQSFRSEIEEEKEVYADPGNAQTQASTSSSQEATSELALVVVPPDQKSSAWKTDIHALAVSYKIKRLKQQLAVLEKLAAEGKEEAAAATKPSGSEASCSSSSSRQHPRTRYHTMMSFLSKHVKRYQSLDDKIDDLCARMEESKRSVGRERHGAGEQSVALGQFLEETFQLQRFMVATGQKLLETQKKIAPGLSRGGEDGVDMKRLMDVAGALLRDVQRGLEVRIARIIGDLEGTLTFRGILRTAR
ncbi:hypothetical protein BAE44_0022116 [Dichanthelium oligosanthes]|uniref:Uncharacterized protein n=1 Tax=Dichanthelium oligosanthes TaxID=888268 RepID=A0A1E5UVR1_9POAL|nr:hypothetical protein BAE44_0022116 [Dichanthelium oligosanthes]